MAALDAGEPGEKYNLSKNISMLLRNSMAKKEKKTRRGKRRPQYSWKIIQAARLIWFDERNDYVTCEKLKAKFPDETSGMPRQTIQRWRLEYKWDEWAQSLDMQIDQKMNENLIDRRMELTSDVAVLTNQVKTMALACKKPFRSTREAIATFRDCLQMEKELRGWDKLPTQLNIEKIVNQLFVVLASDPKIGPLLADRQKIILEDLQRKLESGNGKSIHITAVK